LNWDNRNNNPQKITENIFEKVLHVLISALLCDSGVNKGKKETSSPLPLIRPDFSKGIRRSSAYNDNEGSMEKFLENLIIDIWGGGEGLCCKWTDEVFDDVVDFWRCLPM
jgi:hypothetical protein